MTRRWLLWPPSAAVPSWTDTPSEVPMTLDSRSWVAKPLPANRTSIQPSRTSAATDGPAPVWMTAGPHTASTLAPPSLARRIRVRDLVDQQRLGLLGGDLGVHELEGVDSARPRRRRRPGRPRCRPRPGHRCAPDAWARRSCGPDGRTPARSPSRAGPGRSTGPRRGPRWAGWSSSRSRPGTHRRARPPGVRRRRSSTRLAPWIWSSSSSDCRASASAATDLEAGPGSVGVGLADLHVEQPGSRRRPPGSGP